MTDLDKARRWAEDGKGLYSPGSRAKAVIDIILSLPDQWVDANEVRELVSTFHSKEDVPFTPFVAVMAFKECAEALESLLTPKLPTLADMTQEEREACQWMQCKVETDDGYGIGVIRRILSKRAGVIFQSGMIFYTEHRRITPLPDLPKLKWPGGVVDCEIVDEPETTGSDSIHTPMQPSEVPANEPWLIEVDGQEAIGTRYKGDAHTPWSVASLDGSFAGDYNDREVSLIHKLVPETHALPEGMRLADHERFGRVVVSPRVDMYGRYSVFYLNYLPTTGSSCQYVNPDLLTFLDGDQHA